MAQRHEMAIFEVRLQSSDFSSCSIPLGILTCNNPPLELPSLRSAPACLPAFLFVSDKPGSKISVQFLGVSFNSENWCLNSQGLNCITITTVAVDESKLYINEPMSACYSSCRQ